MGILTRGKRAATTKTTERAVRFTSSIGGAGFGYALGQIVRLGADGVVPAPLRHVVEEWTGPVPADAPVLDPVAFAATVARQLAREQRPAREREWTRAEIVREVFGGDESAFVTAQRFSFPAPLQTMSSSGARSVAWRDRPVQEWRESFLALAARVV